MLPSKAFEEALLNAPAMAAPPGMHHNFVDPPNLQTIIHIVMIVCLSLSMLAVGMRMWTKTRVVRRVALEDLFCCLALATFVAHCAVLFNLLKRHKSGVHQWNMRLGSLRFYLYNVRIIQTIYCVEIFAIKVVILLQYLRVFVPRTRSLIFWASHALIWLNFICYSILFFLAMFTCIPINKYWNPWIEGECLNIGKVITFAASFNAASDLLILILPQPLIWNLQMTLKKKIALSAVFLVGICACVSAITRIYYSIKMFKVQDYTYYFSILDMWVFIEIAFAFLAACLPYSPKFFKSLKNPMHFFTQPKTESTHTGIRTAEHKPNKIREGLNNLNALFKKHNILVTGMSMKGEKKSNTNATHSTETSQNLESMRTGLDLTMSNPAY